MTIIQDKTIDIQLKWFEQLGLYIATFIGVVFHNPILIYSKTGVANIDISFSIILLSLVIALIIMPIIYEKFGSIHGKPFIFQFSIFVTYGFLWQFLLSSIFNSLK